MNHPTPRKSRGHRHQLSSGGGGGGTSRGGGASSTAAINATSDYDSDMAHYMEAHPSTAASAALQGNSNDIIPQFNFTVLRRYIAGLRAIICSAPTAQAYAWDDAANNWLKQDMEGPLFTCDLEPLAGTALPRSCLFLLNRKSLENMAIDLMRVSDLEPLEGLLSFRMESEAENDQAQGGRGLGAGGIRETNGGGDGAEAGGGGYTRRKVMGIWIHPDEPDRREINHSIIMSAWQQSRASWNALLEAGGGVDGHGDGDERGVASGAGLAPGGAYHAPGPHETSAPLIEEVYGGGRRISISELFGQGNGGR